VIKATGASPQAGAYALSKAPQAAKPARPSLSPGQRTGTRHTVPVCASRQRSPVIVASRRPVRWQCKPTPADRQSTPRAVNRAPTRQPARSAFSRPGLSQRPPICVRPQLIVRPFLAVGGEQVDNRPRSPLLELDRQVRIRGDAGCLTNPRQPGIRSTGRRNRGHRAGCP